MPKEERCRNISLNHRHTRRGGGGGRGGEGGGGEMVKVGQFLLESRAIGLGLLVSNG